MNDIIKMTTGELSIALEGEVMKAVQKVGIDVDKDKLLEALQLADTIVRCKECKRRKKNGFCLEHNRYEKNDNEMNEICGDNRFEIIAKAKKHLLDATNIDTSPDEMKVLDSFLFRCWQMGWLDRYESKESE